MIHLPKVSIIIPVYNTEKYLRKCLDSVRNQTEANLEAIIINDRTTDNSMAIAKEFSAGDSRFKIIDHEVNKGLGSARNTGIKNAQGKYINFLDSDDCLPVDAIQLMLNNAEKNASDMVIGNMAWIGVHNLTYVKYINEKLRLWNMLRLKNVRQNSEKYSFVGSVCNRLIKREILTNNEITFPTSVYFEDIPFTFKIWFFSNNITFTENFVYFRTRRNDPANPSITQIYNEKAFTDRDVIAQQVYDVAKNTPGAEGLGIETLLLILTTTKNMLSSTKRENALKINTIWFPQHLLRINSMVNDLRKKILGLN